MYLFLMQLQIQFLCVIRMRKYFFLIEASEHKRKGYAVLENLFERGSNFGEVLTDMGLVFKFKAFFL